MQPLGRFLNLSGLCMALAGLALAAPASGAELVRVRILYAKRPVRLEATGPWRFHPVAGGKTYGSSSAVRVRAMGKALVFDQRKFKGDVVAEPLNSSDTLKLKGRRYRGSFVFHPLGKGRYDAVETVDLEEYLYGVLPREVETGWPLDALKAQAVVSRSYALANRTAGDKVRYDLSDGVFDQVYGGMDVESPLSNRAVDETRGEVLVGPSGKVVEAYFHSSCGGRTELPQHVWKSSQADEVYGSVPDTFCQEDPHYQWSLQLSLSTIRERLRRAGVRVREIKKISIVKKSLSGRAEIIGLKTSGGTTEISGNRFRLALGADALRSTLFTDISQSKKSVLIKGHGWGHGGGLCQWGARGRAATGQKYGSILKTYYPGAVLKRVADAAP